MNVFLEFERRIKKKMQLAGIKTKEGMEIDFSRICVEAPREPSHGDLATNAAMVLAKQVGENPQVLAGRIAELLQQDKDITSVKIAGPGFVNLRLTDDFWLGILADMIRQGKDYGRLKIGAGRKVNVEYVSANPTGPLHVGHCRGAVSGDALANLLRFTGYDVVKEYYINDAGGQVDVLARSVFWRYREVLGEETGDIPDCLYPGTYLVPVAKSLADDFDRKLLLMDHHAVLQIVRERAINAMMQMIRDDLATLGIHHDVFFSERTLHADHACAVREAIDNLTVRGYVYKGKLPPPKGQLPDDWEDREQTLLRSTEVGDDMDRPLIKSDGTYTYLAGDVAYFKNKYDRGFQEMIYLLGADHNGYVKRLEAVARAVAGEKARLRVLLCQLVNLYRDGEPVRMGKRTGNFVTLRDVVDEVGRDPVRFMMLYRNPDAPLDFDFAKVTEKSRDNPVFYVQYASARCHSIFRQACEVIQIGSICRDDLVSCIGKINAGSELALVRKMAEYPRLIEMAALHQEPHRLAFYLYDLASAFHAHWNLGNEYPDLRFVQTGDREKTLARLGLVQSVANILESGLGIIGVEAPSEMIA